MAVRLGSAHFNDVVIEFPMRRGLDSWRKTPAILEVGKSAHPLRNLDFITLISPKRASNFAILP
jgi:hypothetical protein